MKNLVLLLLVAILLTACQSAATPQPTAVPPPERSLLTPTPVLVEGLANSTSDLVGIWSFGVLKLEFKADSTYRLFFGSGNNTETVDEGTYIFDAGKVTWAVTSYCPNKPATYEAYVTKQEGKPVSLRLHVVGSDPCKDRADVSGQKAVFKNP